MITEAVYQDGVLRMKRPLNLANQSVVHVQVMDKSATEHPHVARVEGVHNGRPIIRGTRIPVKTLVGYIHMGMAVPEVLSGFAGLTAAQLYGALSYYYDNQAEIEADMGEDELPALLQRFDLVLGEDGRLTPQQ